MRNWHKDSFLTHYNSLHFSLVNRQKSWHREEQERIAAIPDPDLPEGHRVMPQHERLAMLEKLRASRSYGCYCFLSLLFF